MDYEKLFTKYLSANKIQSFFKKYTKNNTEISQAKCTILKTFQIDITKFQPKLIRKKNTYTHLIIFCLL